MTIPVVVMVSSRQAFMLSLVQRRRKSIIRNATTHPKAADSVTEVSPEKIPPKTMAKRSSIRQKPESAFSFSFQLVASPAGQSSLFILLHIKITPQKQMAMIIPGTTPAANRLPIETSAITP